MGFLNTALSTSTGSLTAPVYEGYSHEDFGAQHIIMESSHDTLMVFEALSDLDIITLRGEESVMESAVSNVIERAKSALKKLWGKIKAFFESIIRYFDALTKSAADFAKKYEKQLTTKDLSNFKRKMYKYSIMDAPDKKDFDVDKFIPSVEETLSELVSSSGAEKAKEELAATRERFEDYQNEIRSAVVGEKVDSHEEFKKSLFAMHRSGAEGKEDMEEIDVEIRSIIAAVKESPKLKRAVEAAKSNTDKSFSKYITALGKAHVKVSKESDLPSETLSVLSGMVALSQKAVTFQKTCLLELFNSWITAIKERDSAYKSAMRAAFGHNAEKAANK